MMRWTTLKGGSAGRALIFVMALLAGSIGIWTSTAAAGEQQRRAIPPSILTDPPTVEPLGRDARPVELSGSEARVRVSADRIAAASPAAAVVVRALDRPAGAVLSASLEPVDSDEVVATGSTARRTLSLADLPADPGRYELTVAVGGRELGTAPIALVPQARSLIADTSAVATAAKRGAPSRQRVAAGDLNADLYFDEGPQASSAVAIAFGDPGRTISATADAGGAPIVVVSNDGLRAGSETALTMPGGGIGTPAVAADPAGDLWAAAAGGAGGSPIRVARIPPGSASFAGSPVELPSGGAADLQQAPTLAVDPGNQIAAGWVRTNGINQEVVVSVCDISGGASACDSASAWSAPVPVSAAPAQYATPDLGFGPAGEIYAVWWNASSANAIEANRCAAGEDCTTASSWNEQSKIEDLDAAGGAALPLLCPIVAAPGGLVGPSPSVAVGADGLVHIAYSDLRDNADPGNSTRCTGGGSDATFDSYVASGAAPEAFPNANAGVRLSTDAPTALNDHFLPALTVDDESGLVEASFYSTQDNVSGQFTHRYYATSADGGRSFQGAGRLSSDRSRFSGAQSNGVDYGDRQSMDSVGGVTRAVWTDARALQNNDGVLYGLVPPSDTTITAGPPTVTPNATESVSFTTNAYRTECALDGLAFGECTSPVTYGPLPNGSHTVRVLATDKLGNPVDPTPATVSWQTQDLDPPETTVTQAPPEVTFERKVTFDLAADEQAAIFECSYDGLDYQRCRPPKSQKIELGRHVFNFRAVDVGGNADPTPASVNFVRKRECKQIRGKLKRKFACALERCGEIAKNRKNKRKGCIAKATKRNAKAKLKKQVRKCREIGPQKKRAACITKAEKKFDKAIAKAEKKSKKNGS